MALTEAEKVGTKESYFDLFKKKVVILYFFGIFAYVGVEQGISYWMSKYLQIYHGYDYETIGANAVGNFWGLMTIGGIFGLLLLKLMDSKIVLKLFSILAILSLAMALFGIFWNFTLRFCGFRFFSFGHVSHFDVARPKFGADAPWILYRDFDDGDHGRCCGTSPYRNDRRYGLIEGGNVAYFYSDGLYPVHFFLGQPHNKQ